MNTLFLLMAKYQSPRMDVDQIADFLHLAPKVVRNRIYAKDMPFPVYKEGGGYYADLNDVAAYHDRMAQSARDAHAAMIEAMA